MTGERIANLKSTDISKGFVIDGYDDDSEYGPSLLEKAIVVFKAMELLKAKKMPVGTVSRGRRKVAEGKWVPISEKKESAAKGSTERYTFDAQKEGWKDLHGADKKALDLSKENPGKYVLYSVTFSTVRMVVKPTLPTSAYAPDDFPRGYWRNGERFDWSKKRKDRVSMMGLGVSD